MFKATSTNKQHYKIITHTKPPINMVYKYEKKINKYFYSKNNWFLTTQELLDLESMNSIIDDGFVNYLFYKHMDVIVRHVRQKGIKIDFEHGINLMLKNCLDCRISERFYENTIEQYKNLVLYNIPTINDIIDISVRKGNTNLLFYLYYREEKEIYNCIYNIKACRGVV